MTGIYEDSFIDFLKEYLGDIKITRKNIICRCPYCEMESDKKHFHLYISLESPIFHCFKSECNQKGGIDRLTHKLSGKNIDDFFDKSLKKIKSTIPAEDTCITIPDIKPNTFVSKVEYLKKRLMTADDDLIYGIENLILDINTFLSSNNLINQDIEKYKDFLHENFVGFLTKNRSILVLRNIDESSKLRYHKITIKQVQNVDYYLTYNDMSKSNITIAEGIFDILMEKKIDTINKKENTSLYAACLSTNYESLIKSLAYYESAFRQNITILSDRGISLKYYRRIKQNTKHIIDSMTIYYNMDNKDFGETAKNIEKFVI